MEITYFLLGMFTAYSSLTIPLALAYRYKGRIISYFAQKQMEKAFGGLMEDEE